MLARLLGSYPTHQAIKTIADYKGEAVRHKQTDEHADKEKYNN